MLTSDATSDSVIGNQKNRLYPVFTFFGLFLFLIGSGGWAASQSMEAELELKALLRSAVKDLTMTPSLGRENPFCRAFADDFKGQTSIQYLSPIIRAEHYDDSALAPYKKQCRHLQLNKLITVPAGDKVTREQSEEELEAYGNVYLGLRNFQLFKVDINNNPDDGEEYVFYYEGERNKKTNRTNSGRAYRIINFSQCKIDDGVYFNRGASDRWSLNGIIHYKGKNGILLLASSIGAEPSFYLLSLQVYQPSLNKIATICNYKLSK